MPFTPTPEAYRLFHDGQLALSEVEHEGVRVDRGYLRSAMDAVAAEIKGREDALRDDPMYRTWRRRYGESTNLASPEQLATVLFRDMGYTSPVMTASGRRESASEKSLESVDLPFVRSYLHTQKLRKLRGTYLEGIWREAVQHDDGLWYVHPSYNLNTVITFRSSCDNPNYQNIYSRNPEFAEIVRRAYIPRPGDQFGELDYGQIEVRVPCFYHSDPVLMAYVTDATKDMHRDMAAQIFKLEPKQVHKALRHVAKNMFVFPTFYGSYYAQCAPDMWEAVDKGNIPVEGVTVPDGKGGTRPKTVREHLTEVGIKSLGACDPDQEPAAGTFEAHLKEIEDHFWGVRFKVYAQWKRDWWAAYLRAGGFRMLSGFAVNAVLDRKQVCNAPIQGVAFHLALWSLVKINRILRRYKFRSRVIGEIHDCINFNMCPKERDDVINLSVRVMTQDVLRWAPWVNVPLTVEPECCPIDQSWFYKFALVDKEGSGKWRPADESKWESKFGPWSKQLVA